MNKAVYDHKKKTLDKLCKKQHRTYRELKRLWLKARKQFITPKEIKFKIEELEAQNDSLNMTIEVISNQLLRYQLFKA